MRNYELMMVILPHLDEESLTVTLDRVGQYINERGGLLVQQERWGIGRRLAYSIRGYSAGSYILTHFQIEPQYTRELEANLISSEDVLRHLLIQVDDFGKLVEEKPPVVASSEDVLGDALPESPLVDEGTIPETPNIKKEPVSDVETPSDTVESGVIPVEETTSTVKDEVDQEAKGQVQTLEDEIQDAVPDEAEAIESQMGQGADMSSEEGDSHQSEEGPTDTGKSQAEVPGAEVPEKESRNGGT